ncbi:hypothetical protein [Botrimarina hoheduenensis]|uniref:Uncharacterized protein n=1 Tax=Botrimarina hoheduenensis TaxID=2528000 RepID=A0A5C5W0F4_9BACT|nr:hypothetical protein [Botrimarina hoheduenensis]TWT43252.1 hypothetical protein Pla111_22020 [Botrimarina hoheduenensis]
MPRFRLSLRASLLGVSALGILLALATINARQLQRIERLEERLTALEAESVLVISEGFLSSVGIPMEVDRAMQLDANRTVRR